MSLFIQDHNNIFYKFSYCLSPFFYLRYTNNHLSYPDFVLVLNCVIHNYLGNRELVFCLLLIQRDTFLNDLRLLDLTQKYQNQILLQYKDLKFFKLFENCQNLKFSCELSPQFDE